MPEDQIDKLQEMLADFDTAMLITHGNNPLMHARPMAIAKVEKNCDLWFFTGRESMKVHEIKDGQEVLVVCQDEHSRYIALLGSAELVSDRSQFQAFWKEPYKTWFPGGVEDPDLLLIHVYAREAEYWDNQGTKGVKYMFQSVKAYATGTRPETKEGEQHGKVALK